MRAAFAHPVALIGAVALTLTAAHFADRVAYGQHMKARGLAPSTSSGGGGKLMAAHVPVDRNLHAAGFEDRIAQTYLGQAHLAGTGPTGTACRTCSHWRRDQDEFDPAKAREAYCEYPIPGKHRHLIPASAGSCRFYKKGSA